MIFSIVKWHVEESVDLMPIITVLHSSFGIFYMVFKVLQHSHQNHISRRIGDDNKFYYKIKQMLSPLSGLKREMNNDSRLV